MNFYEELKLKKESTLEELQAGLDSIERVWHQRELIQPEKAQEMLNKVNEARSCFSSEESRKQYDSSLVSEKHENITDEEKERRDNFLKHSQMAYSFYQTQEYDLAIAEAEKTIQYLREGDNSDFYGFTAEVYKQNGDYQKAIEFINKAILDNPKDPTLYETKGDILIQSELKQLCGKPADFSNGLACFERALTAAQDTGDLVEEGIAAAHLAYYNFYNSKPNIATAKRFAEYALLIGDNTGMAQDVINAINELEKKNVVEQEREEIIQMMLNESIKSSNEYYFEYTAKKNSFLNSAKEGETVGIAFLNIIIEALELFAVEINYDYKRAAIGGSYKFHGYVQYVHHYTPTDIGVSIPAIEGIQCYLTLDNWFKIDFDGKRVLTENTNNQLALKILELAIEKGLTSEDALILPWPEKMNPKKIREKVERETKEKAEREAKEKAEEEEKQRKEKQRMEWILQDKCAYCGGDLKGLFTKKCVNCGREKDY